MGRSLIFDKNGIHLPDYPPVSIILTADCSLPITEQCLLSLNYLDYPTDQLEYVLILPPQRPCPNSLELASRLKAIQFDVGVKWSLLEARLEGLSLAKGNYVQFLDACMNIKPLWLEKALSHLNRNGSFGVTGEVENGEASANGSPGQSGNTRRFNIPDGLYKRNELLRYCENGRSNRSGFQPSEVVAKIPEEMAFFCSSAKHTVMPGIWSFSLHISRFKLRQKLITNQA